MKTEYKNKEEMKIVNVAFKKKKKKKVKWRKNFNVVKSLIAS